MEEEEIYLVLKSALPIVTINNLFSKCSQNIYKYNDLVKI